MYELEDILGQTEIIDTIFDFIETEEKKIFLLEGESGCGKSYLSQKLTQKWTKNNPSNFALFFRGDNSYSERYYFPFLTCTFIRNEVFAKKAGTEKAILEVSKDVPGIGNLLSFMVSALSNSRKKVKYESAIIFNQTELDIFFKLQFYAKKGKLFLVADNFHWWDEQSISFLKLLCSDETRNTYSFLKDSIILIITTANQEKVSKKAMNEFVNNFVKKKVVLKSIELKKYELVLQSFGVEKKISPNILSILFAQTGGHLELIKNLVDYINKKNSNNFEGFNTLAEVDIYKEKILEERLKLYGATGGQIIDLLAVASIIGLSFDYAELECLTKKKKSILKNIILESNELSITKHDEGKIFFRHEIFKAFFLCKLNSKKSEYYIKFAECLRILRPGDYNSRARYLFDAGEIEDSVVYYISGYLNSIRNGKNYQETAIKIEILAKEYGLDEYYKLMVEAYKSFNKRNYEEAIQILKNIEDFYPKLLLAEKDYLLSICYSKSLDISQRIEAKNILSIWINDKIKVKEGEVWIRVMSTLIILNIHLNDYYEARRMEKFLLIFLSERKNYDPLVYDAINIIRRKANALHSAEISALRTKHSIEHFKATDDYGEIKNPIQYYMALANHSGNLIICGEFKEANFYSNEAIKLLSKSENMEFPRPEIPINNFIVSGFLSGELSPDDGINLYNKIFAENTCSDYADHVLLLNNQAILLVHSNNFKEAIFLLDKAINFLKEKKSEDNFYEYYLKMNLLTLNSLLGYKKNLKTDLKKLFKRIPCLPDSDKESLMRRHTFYEKSLLSVKFKSPGELDSYLLKKDPMGLGKTWRFWGRGFLLSDLQFWSES